MILVARNVLNDLERRTKQFEEETASNAMRALPGYDAYMSALDRRIAEVPVGSRGVGRRSERDEPRR